MRPYELPDFYMPYPARLNPNLETAREHTKAWSYEMGILGDRVYPDVPVIWDEAKFDSMDYALLCSYTHPDAPSRELDLVTDWYVWVFYFDDHFLELYKRTQDKDGAKKYLDGLPAFMPIDPSGATPEPTNAVEGALIDLWKRTVHTKSREWRLRFFESTKNLLGESMWELANISGNRIPNPIEYVEVRRKVGGAPWSADLVEHAVFVEIPARVADSRPMRVLKDTFSDGVHLRNDIFSYQRETQEEGEINNCVLVMERFLRVDPQRAADLTNDMLTSRLQQFENTALTELPSLFEDHALDLLERESVALYVKGLQDWQSGGHAWHMRSSRYMNDAPPREPSVAERLLSGLTGLGTSALQVRLSPGALGLQRFKSTMHMPYERVGPTVLPDFYMPYSSRPNPNYGHSRDYIIVWARQMGMLDTSPGGPGLNVWDEKRLEEFDFAICAARIHPDASAPELDLSSCWLTWGTYADDYFPMVYNATRDMIGAKALIASLPTFMPLDLSPVPPPVHPIARGLADLWFRTAPPLTPFQRCQFRQAIEAMLESWLWELANHIQHRIPDPVDYVEMRRRTFGSDLTLNLGRITKAGRLPAELLASRPIRALENSACDYACFMNDVFSYQKEIEFEGELHNIVLVVQKFLDIDRRQAVALVNELMTARMSQFEHIIATELPGLVEDYELGEDDRKALDAYVLHLQDWMVGILEWHVLCRRYREPYLLARYRKAPLKKLGELTGLGTSAAVLRLPDGAQVPV